MVCALLQAVVLMAAPPQGVSVQLQQLELDGASKADAQAVMQGCTDELTAQGYSVIKPDDAVAKPKALISGKLRKTKDEGWLVTLTLSRAADQQILEEVKLEVAKGGLRQAGTDGARDLASAIRATWGVRAKIKL